MTIEIVSGDLLDALDRGEVDQIVHCVNMQKTFGSGLALAIKQRYPEVYKEYASKTGHLGFADFVYLDNSTKGVWNLYLR
jgi:O-acetyl-ADP-ribose deacetylase (regulator of RNase III)